MTHAVRREQPNRFRTKVCSMSYVNATRMVFRASCRREVGPVSSLAAYENAVANLSAAIAEAQARIECADLPEVVSNPTQLLQVFQNLISNALHYRGAVRPHIRVSAERQNSFWLFSVSDNGPGIAPQYHSLIFEPFKEGRAFYAHDRGLRPL